MSFWWKRRTSFTRTDIDDTSLFVVNVTSDVSNQEQQSQIDEGQPDQLASSYESSIVVENNQ